MKYEMLSKPYEHQQRIFDESKDREYYAILWEMGLGKSKLTLDTVGHLYTEGKIDAALIVSPAGVYETWFYDQIPQHLGLEDYYYGCYYSSPRAKQKEEMDQMLKKQKTLVVCCINTEAFSGQKGVEYAMRFVKTHRTIVIIDESTSIKTPKAARTKALLKIGQLAKYRRILTGTPITQSPLDLFAQCEFLKKGCLGFSSFTAFRSYFSIIKPLRLGTRYIEQIVGYKNLDYLEKELRPMSSRITKNDCLDLPEKIYMTRYVNLTPEQERVYKSLKSLALAELTTGLVTTASALTTLMKLQQVVCGHCIDDMGESCDIPNNRLPALLDIAEEVTGKIIIFCVFRRDVQQIVKALSEKYGKDSVVDYYGGTASNDRQDNIVKFRKDPDCRFFVSSSSGSKGITLVESCTTVYYSNGYNLETRLQSEDRNHRIGQNSSVTYIDLVCPGTVDEKIVRALKEKKNLADSVLDTLRDEVYCK